MAQTECRGGGWRGDNREAVKPKTLLLSDATAVLLRMATGMNVLQTVSVAAHLTHVCARTHTPAVLFPAEQSWEGKVLVFKELGIYRACVQSEWMPCYKWKSNYRGMTD